MKKILILGGGGFAREACLHLLDTIENCEVAFYDDSPKTNQLKIGTRFFKIFSDFSTAKNAGFKEFIIGVGIPATKIILTKKAQDSGLLAHQTIIHPRALVQDAKVGVGGIICPGTIITTNVLIGDFVVLNLNSTIGHDSVIGDYTTCNPNSSVSGHCKLGNRTFFGVGAAVKEGISIADGVTIGGQAFVTKPILSADSTWIGIPATELKR